MAWTQPSASLTHAAVLEMLRAAVAQADAMGQPQCIVIVDASGETRALLKAFSDYVEHEDLPGEVAALEAFLRRSG